MQPLQNQCLIDILHIEIKKLHNPNNMNPANRMITTPDRRIYILDASLIFPYLSHSGNFLQNSLTDAGFTIYHIPNNKAMIHSPITRRILSFISYPFKCAIIPIEERRYKLMYNTSNAPIKVPNLN